MYVGDKKTPICTSEQMDCFENAENELFNGENMQSGKDDENKYRDLMKCQCLPQCSSLKYELELVKTNYKSWYTLIHIYINMKLKDSDSNLENYIS